MNEREVKVIKNEEGIVVKEIITDPNTYKITDEELLEIIKKYPGLNIKRKEDEPVVIDQSKAHSDMIEELRKPKAYTNKAQDDLLSDQEKTELIRKNPNNIKFFKYPSLELQLQAIELNPWSLKLIKEPHYSAVKAAIEKDYTVIECVRNPSVEIQLMVIAKARSYICKIHNVSEETKIAAVAFDPWVIENIQNPSDEVLKIASSKNKAIEEIINKWKERVEEEYKKVSMPADGYAFCGCPITDQCFCIKRTQAEIKADIANCLWRQIWSCRNRNQNQNQNQNSIKTFSYDFSKKIENAEVKLNLERVLRAVKNNRPIDGAFKRITNYSGNGDKGEVFLYAYNNELMTNPATTADFEFLEALDYYVKTIGGVSESTGMIDILYIYKQHKQDNDKPFWENASIKYTMEKNLLKKKYNRVVRKVEAVVEKVKDITEFLIK